MLAVVTGVYLFDICSSSMKLLSLETLDYGVKIRSKSSLGGEIKPKAPCRNILRHVQNHLQV
jgi:hypothetical protein